eukprot:SM000239S08085  [mRNA]  locus=s239:141780:143642:- [translate_table: standard]
MDAAQAGEGAAASLTQTLQVRRAPNGDVGSGAGWASLETEDLTLQAMDRKQVAVFPEQRAFAVSHLTAELLDQAIQVGVLGAVEAREDKIPPSLRLPSRRPALVSESCLYSAAGDARIRTYHVLDPRGFLDTIGIFRERRGGGNVGSLDDIGQDEVSGEDRLDALLGEWRGQAMTQRSSLYDSTTSKQDTAFEYRRDKSGELVQTMRVGQAGSACTTTLTSRASVQEGGVLLVFGGGLQTCLLPGGLAVSCPRLVARGQAFYFESAWMEAPGRRRRILRTHDPEGMVVSTTVAVEEKVA